jgi:hypothetical protein
MVENKMNQNDNELTTEDVELCIQVRDRLSLQVSALTLGNDPYVDKCVKAAHEAAHALTALINCHT